MNSSYSKAGLHGEKQLFQLPGIPHHRAGSALFQLLPAAVAVEHAHAVNAQLGGEIRDIYDMTYLLKAVFGIVYDEYGFRPDHESLNYYRFVTHLKFYARRIVSGEGYGDEDSDLLDVVRFKYPRAYACADKIRVYVQREKNFHSGQNELLYLTIHIARVMEHPDEK